MPKNKQRKENKLHSNNMLTLSNLKEPSENTKDNTIPVVLKKLKEQQ